MEFLIKRIYIFPTLIMKKIVAYIVLIFFITIYLISSHIGYMKKVTEWKYKSKTIFASDKYSYGDLYGMSYYPIKEVFGSDSLTVPIDKYPNTKNKNLCLVHDSYLGGAFLKQKYQLSGIDTIFDIEYPWRNKPSTPILLDTTKINILVFEIVERHLLTLFDSLTATNVVKFKINIPNAINKRQIIQDEITTASNNSPIEKIVQILFCENVNTNLEFVIFNSRIFTPFKEFKSYINNTFFDRKATDIFVSANKKYMFYSETRTSIEKKITNAEVNKTVKLLNYVYEYYKKKGFSEVYFSIIPNPVSIIEPDCENYNNLIPLIQNNKNLIVPMIDIYTVFKKTNNNIYYHSDTHWNKNGFQLWLNEFNRKTNE